MNLTDSVLRLSATDLANHLACKHLTELNFAKAHKLLEPPYWHDPMVAVLRRRGDEHEAAYLAHLESRGTNHVRITSSLSGSLPGVAAKLRRRVRGPASGVETFDGTLEAMQAGAHAIVQAQVGEGRWHGYADVLLRRDDKPSDLGDYSYEVVDTKLARETKGGTILQLCLYTELVAELQGVMPEFMYVVSPGRNFERECFRVSDYFDYYRMVKGELEDAATGLDSRLRGSDVGGNSRLRGNDVRGKHVSAPDSGPVFAASQLRRAGSRTPDVLVLYPEPCEHCSICRWWKRCNGIRRSDDHLTFVAGISTSQIAELTSHNVDTLSTLAVLEIPLPWRPERGSKAGIERVREQARVQVEQRTKQEPVHELLERVEGEGLARLPEPSDADIFFDLESARFVGDHGLQYLWGVATLVIPTKEGPPAPLGVTAPVDGPSSGSLAPLGMTAAWAGTAAEERAAFERFMDFVMQQWEAFPDLHIYHFGHYEPSTLKQLAQRYATREDELDQLLRAEAFVDLHAIVRQALRAGVEQYSLKDLEPFFAFEREMDLQQASKARHELERGLELDVPLDDIPQDIRDQVLQYNEDDCRATEGLRLWLEKVRSDLIAVGEQIPRPVVASKEQAEEREGRRKDQRELAERLLENIPDDREERSDAQQAQWLLGNVIQFHWREEKATWWEYFRMRELSDAEYLDEQTALAGLEFVEALPIPPRARSPIHRYRFPAQESKIREEHKLCYGDGEIFVDGFGEVVSLDYAARTIDVKKNLAARDVHPTAVFEFSNVKAIAMEDSIFRAGTIVAEEGMESERLPRPQLDLLMGHPPRFRDGLRDQIRLEGETGIDAALRLVMELDGGIFPIQGPPGTGKTYIGARMTCALVRAGKKVGVVANSHKVIDNFLEKLEDAGKEMNVTIRAAHKDGQTAYEDAFISYVNSNPKMREALANDECNVAGGTAWMWAREDFYESVDVLFVDEAGQMSLANVLAAAQGAKNVVLLGDPQQLDQPQRGSHPEGVEVSALEHLLAGAATMPDDRGLFLEKTWRLSEPICDYTSELFYQSRLTGVSKLKQLAIHATPLIEQTGLYFFPVEHEGNQSSCKEEAEAIRRLVHALLGAGTVSPGQGAPSSLGEGGQASSTASGQADKRATWTDRDGKTHLLTLDDILIVAPYNAQVSDIAAVLPEGARVGTVDKFQGQEAPVVIYSMTTSSREDAPRGMEFLYSLNRLNVATSRSKCACILVANPAVLQPDCRSPRQMRLANAFCAYVDRADVVRLTKLRPASA